MIRSIFGRRCQRVTLPRPRQIDASGRKEMETATQCKMHIPRYARYARRISASHYLPDFPETVTGPWSSQCPLCG